MLHNIDYYLSDYMNKLLKINHLAWLKMFNIWIKIKWHLYSFNNFGKNYGFAVQNYTYYLKK